MLLLIAGAKPQIVQDSCQRQITRDLLCEVRCAIAGDGDGNAAQT